MKTVWSGSCPDTSLHLLADGVGDGTAAAHGVLELLWCQGLIPVAHRFFGTRVHFDDQRIRSDGYRSDRHIRYQVRMTRAVTGIYHDRQMRLVFEVGY